MIDVLRAWPVEPIALQVLIYGQRSTGWTKLY